MVKFRPTVAQALARGSYLGGLAGSGAGAVVVALNRVIGGAGWVGWLAGLVVLALLTATGATAWLAFGRGPGADIDDSGIHPVPAGPDAMTRWQDIEDVRVERRGGRTAVTVLLESGAIARLHAPYDGRWLAGDPGFERKLFLLRNRWATHRSFTVSNGIPPLAG